MKRSEKFRRANHEAKVTCLATLAVILFWTLAGFGLSAFDISFFDTPCGCSPAALAPGSSRSVFPSGWRNTSFPTWTWWKRTPAA